MCHRKISIGTEFKSQKHNKYHRSTTVYSPVLALCGFLFFPKPNLPLRENNFQLVEDIQQNLWKEMTAITKRTYEKCFKDGK